MGETARPKKHDLARRYYASLTASEKLSAEKVITHQRKLASTLLRHAEKHIPFYHERLAPIRTWDGSFDFSRWHEIPVMTKADLIAHYDDLHSPVIPPMYGTIRKPAGFPAAGVQVKVPATQLSDLAAACASYRHFESFGFEWTTDLAVISAFSRMPKTSRTVDDETRQWAPPWLSAKMRGARRFFSIHRHPKDQIDWLKSNGPAAVSTSPSNAARLAGWVAAHDMEPPDITVLLTEGETVTPDLRALCRRHLKCEIMDAFSTSECGLIALQCPQSGGYHLQSEIVIAEVVNDKGEPCAEGEPGQLVVTPVMNLAMPLIRYKFDDYMVPGPPCPCGRASPLIEKILGRRDTLFDFADGTMGQLEVSHDTMAGFVGVQRWQIAQTGKRSVELRYMKAAGCEGVDIKGARNYIAGLAGKKMKVTAREVDALGPTPGGKFRNVVNEISV